VIDVSETVAVFSRIMSRLSASVRFFTFFSIIAGGLLIVSSVFATRRQRVREAVYFTILGARSRFVLAVFAVENMIIGLASSLIALALAQTAAWTVCRFGLEIDYRPAPGLAAHMASATVIAVVAVGLTASASVIRRKPAEYLRERAEE
jgi:putative ABC transport system permease protein